MVWDMLSFFFFLKDPHYYWLNSLRWFIVLNKHASSLAVEVQISSQHQPDVVFCIVFHILRCKKEIFKMIYLKNLRCITGQKNNFKSYLLNNRTISAVILPTWFCNTPSNRINRSNEDFSSLWKVKTRY